MAIKYYLQVNGIPGDSTAQDFRNWIDTLSYSWGGNSTASFDNLTGRVSDQPVLITTSAGKHTPPMLEKFHRRERISSVVLVGSDNRTEIIRIALSNVYIQQWEMAGSASADVPAESWGLLYESARIKIGTAEESWTPSVG